MTMRNPGDPIGWLDGGNVSTGQLLPPPSCPRRWRVIFSLFSSGFDAGFPLFAERVWQPAVPHQNREQPVTGGVHSSAQRCRRPVR